MPPKPTPTLRSLPFRLLADNKVFCIIAAVLLAAAAIAAQVSPSTRVSASFEAERRFAEVRNNPPELRAFLYRMPKGADLHNHLSGAVYAETILQAAAARGLCIDQIALAIIPCTSGRTDAAKAQSDNNLRNAMIDSLSMRNFVPGKESGHDHFFATFGKFGPTDGRDFIGEVVQRAADQNESYMELMAVSGGGLNDLGTAAGLDDNFDVTRRKLEQDKRMADVLAGLRTKIDEMEKVRRATLHCEEDPGSSKPTPVCSVQVRYVYQVARESPKEGVFAQVIGGFLLAASDPRVVAINFVQGEDGIVSMRDYHLQMRMVDYAKSQYPAIHVTLHAGELTLGLVPPDGLSFHIREAVELGHAERIGHGVDIMYERGAVDLLQEMHDRRVAVEINLTSNDVILGVSGAQHPFKAYRKASVPLVLSTDDEGVSRIDLTNEYERAVLTYDLSYGDLKELVRNSLEYSFAPGASFWEKGSYSTPVAVCAAGMQTASCVDFLSKNEKARLQVDLEARFTQFEGAMRR
jgi:adenosine deaminase